MTAARRAPTDECPRARRCPSHSPRRLAAPGRCPPRPGDLAPAQRVARAPRLERRLGRLGEAPLERGEQPRERRLDRAARQAERRRRQRRGRVARSRRRAQLVGQLIQLDGDVQADPEHRPALLRASLDEDPRELREALGRARGEHDVVRPLDRGVRRPRRRRPPRRRSAAAAAAASAAPATSAARCRPARPAPALASAPGASARRP